MVMVMVMGMGMEMEGMVSASRQIKMVMGMRMGMGMEMEGMVNASRQQSDQGGDGVCRLQRIAGELCLCNDLLNRARACVT